MIRYKKLIQLDKGNKKLVIQHFKHFKGVIVMKIDIGNHEFSIIWDGI